MTARRVEESISDAPLAVAVMDNDYLRSICVESDYKNHQGDQVSFFAELRRRNVFKVGADYVKSCSLPTFDASEWVAQTIRRMSDA